jgi:hypothetical protein
MEENPMYMVLFEMAMADARANLNDQIAARQRNAVRQFASDRAKRDHLRMMLGLVEGDLRGIVVAN